MKKIYSKFTRERDKRYQIETAIYKMDDGSKTISKSALLPEGRKHLEDMYKNYEYFESLNIHLLVPCWFKDDELFFEFIEGESYYTQILKALEEKKRERFFEILNKYKSVFAILYKDKKTFHKTAEFKQVFGDCNLTESQQAVEKLNIDLTFDNLVEKNSGTFILDYEWIFDFPIPVKFSIYRALYAIALKHQSALSGLISEDELFEYFQISKMEREEFAKMNMEFMKYVEGKTYSYSRILEQYKKNVYFLDEEAKGTNHYAQVYRDKGSGYSEEDSRTYIISDNMREVNLEILLTQEDMPSEIRIDPLDTEVMLHIICFEAETDDGIRKITLDQTENNICLCSGSDVIFKSKDPQILIKIPKEEKWKKIRFRYEVLLADLEKSEPYVQIYRKKDEVSREKLKSKVEEQGALLHESAMRFAEMKELLQMYKDKLNYIESTRIYRTLLQAKVEQIHLWDKLKESDI